MSDAAPRPPAVSVVIPAYKAGATIATALASVAAQTLADWEVVVVDDCSPDDTAAALGPWRDDPRVRLFRNPVNLGPSGTRNFGVSVARGRFVAFLDHDDAWLPAKLERQLAAVLACPDPDRVFCVCLTRIKLLDGRYIVRPKRAKRADERMDEFIFVSGGFCQTSSFFLSRALAAEVGFRELATGEDHLFAVDAMARGADYLLVPEELSIYNNDIRPGRLSAGNSLAQGRTFMAQVRALISPKALLGYESRYLGTQILRTRPLAGLRLVAKAVAAGALPPRFAASLLARAVIPAGVYHRMRAQLLGR